jgi:hypothetical protein
VEIQIKVAQTLPVLGKANEAVSLLRELMEQPLPVRHETAVAASLTWLLWRADEREARMWLERAKKLAGERPNDTWAIGILGLLAEWESDPEGALEAYPVKDVFRISLLFDADFDAAKAGVLETD